MRKINPVENPQRAARGFANGLRDLLLALPSEAETAPSLWDMALVQFRTKINLYHLINQNRATLPMVTNNSVTMFTENPIERLLAGYRKILIAFTGGFSFQTIGLTYAATITPGSLVEPAFKLCRSSILQDRMHNFLQAHYQTARCYLKIQGDPWTLTLKDIQSLDYSGFGIRRIGLQNALLTKPR